MYSHINTTHSHNSVNFIHASICVLILDWWCFLEYPIFENVTHTNSTMVTTVVAIMTGKNKFLTTLAKSMLNWTLLWIYEYYESSTCRYTKRNRRSKHSISFSANHSLTKYHYSNHKFAARSPKKIQTKELNLACCDLFDCLFLVYGRIRCTYRARVYNLPQADIR